MKKLIYLVLAIALQTNAFGQDEKMNDIHHLLTITNSNQLGKSMIQNMMNMYKTDYGYEMSEAWDSVSSYLQEGMDELMDSLALIYNNVYSHDEIKQMIQLYQTPIGRKMIETYPIVNQLSMTAGKNWAMAHKDSIESIIAPYVENHPNPNVTYNDFFDADEAYEKAIDYEVRCSKNNNLKIAGSNGYKYNLKINEDQWEQVPNDMINPIADVTFFSKDQSVFCLVIAEKEALTLQQLKAAALYNMSRASDNFKINTAFLKEINGKEMIHVDIDAEIDGENVKYHNLYYSGEWGILQFIVATPQEYYEENSDIIKEVMTGLFVE
ncbi:MAG: DUF2059 domain-containing protein [Bacteroidota bacterium]